MTHKFRVWDSNRKLMSQPFGFGDLFGYEGELNAIMIYNKIGHSIGITSHQNTPRSKSWYSMANGVEPEITIMQYTGIEDKNQREICESDIVINEHGEEQVVQWSNKITNETFGHGEFGHKVISGFILGSHGKIWEIIGNIFENPDAINS